MNNKTDIDVQYVSPLKKILMTIGELPSSYLETMSYYEMLVWFTEFLRNKVIPTVNNNAEATSELQTLYEELRTYVNNYFDNLDVQEEVDNKLDEMAESGQLTDIIAQYLGLAGMIAYDTVADMKLAQNLVNGSKCKTLGFYSVNDGGGAYYKIRTVTNEDVINEMNIIALYDNTLVAELIIENEINILQLGAKNDETFDSTNHIQLAINNYKNIYIPNGSYLITDTLVLKSNQTIRGCGTSSVLIPSKSMTMFTEDEHLYRTTIDNLKFSYDGNDSVTGISIISALRGNNLSNLWFEGITNPIYLGETIYGLFNVSNIYGLLLNDSLDQTAHENSCGIYAGSNTIFMKNIEFIGLFYKGVHFENANCCSLKDGNISGTGTKSMHNSIVIENCDGIDIENVWIEKINDGNADIHFINSLGIKDSNSIKISNVYMPTGCLYVDNSINVDLTNVQYFTTSSGLRYLNNSEIISDRKSLGFCNYQSMNDYSCGKVYIKDLPYKASNNIKNNPLFFKGIFYDVTPRNSNLTTITQDETNQLTGDLCLSVQISSNNQGVDLNATNYLTQGKVYTALAFVKIVNNISEIHMSGGATQGDFPNTAIKPKEVNNYTIVKRTFVAGETTTLSLIASRTDTTQSGTFILDSWFIFNGYTNYEIDNIDKKSIMRNSKLYYSRPPASGTWNKGDVVYNTFTNSTYDTDAYWIYDGTQWVAKTL